MNFAGFIQAGALNGQGLSNAFVQVVTNNQPIYSYFMYEFRGYDAALSMLMLLNFRNWLESKDYQNEFRFFLLMLFTKF
jgi:hypothetical protein